MSEGSLSIRVVRTVHTVAPRRLTAKDVIDACPDDSSGNVYATLSQLSTGNRCPLAKRKNDAGVMEYGTSPEVDIERWLKDRSAKPAGARTPDAPADEATGREALEIVRIVFASKAKRLTANEIYESGNFTSRGAVMFEFAKLCRHDGPLDRQKAETGDLGAVPTFYYAIRDGFDVEAWLAERQGLVESESKAAAAPAAHTRTSAPEPPGSGAAPAPAAGPRVVRGRDMAERRPPEPNAAPRSEGAQGTGLPEAGRHQRADAAASPGRPAAVAAPQPKAAAPAPAPAASAPACTETAGAAPKRRPAAEILAELHDSTLADLIDAAPESSDPRIASLGRRLITARELRDEFTRVPA